MLQFQHDVQDTHLRNGNIRFETEDLLQITVDPTLFRPDRRTLTANIVWLILFAQKRMKIKSEILTVRVLVISPVTGTVRFGLKNHRRGWSL